MYIQIDVTIYEHPKTKKLSRTLGVSRVAAVGHLAALWAWAAQYAPDGDLTTYLDEPDALADAAMWEGDARTFFDALVNARFGDGAGFLEITVDGALVLHDWDQFFGKTKKSRDANAERMRIERARQAEEQARLAEEHARTQAAQPAPVAPPCDACPASPDAPCDARDNDSDAACNARASHVTSTCALNNNINNNTAEQSKTTTEPNRAKHNSNNTARAPARDPEPVVDDVVGSQVEESVVDAVDLINRLDLAPQQLAALCLLVTVAPDYVNPIAFVRANNPKLVAYWALYIHSQPATRIEAIDNIAGLINTFVKAGTFPQIPPPVRRQYDELVDKFLHDPGDPDIAEFIDWLASAIRETAQN